MNHSRYIHTRQRADRLIALLALIALSPLVLAISFVIRVRSGKPVIYKQNRVGQGGAVFTLYKFRSMINNAAALRPTVDSHDELVTSEGKLLRKLSLDELPQLVNVVKGDMAVIGPRPVLEHQYETMNRICPARFTVAPGITGYAQAYGRNAVHWDDRLQMDEHYVRNASPWLDVRTLVRTVTSVLFSQNTDYPEGGIRPPTG